MSQKFSDDIKRFATIVDDAAVAAIVKHLGIALQSKDASLVSMTDKKERDRVRDSWLKKKLGLTHDDATLDQAILDIGDRMKADSHKQRVTFYYLLAEKFDKLKALT